MMAVRTTQLGGVSFDDTCHNNKLILNSVNSIIKYYLPIANNEIVDFDEETKFYNSCSIDISNLTGFEGKELLKFTVSDDMDYGQISTNKGLRICDTSGVLKEIQVSNIYIGDNTAMNTYNGINNMLDSAALYLPKNGYNVAGCIKFNSSTKKFEGYNGENWVELG